MTTRHIKPDCRTEVVTALDIIDGLDTLKGRSGQGTVLRPPGLGPDELLAWAISEVTAAARAGEETAISKLCTNAVMNSRRALACLVDWYIDRDLAKYCKKPPATPTQQAQFLMSRGIVDELTSHVLERAVGKRNRVEHEYVVPTLPEAEDVVELLRRTMATLRSQSDPSLAPMLFGTYLGGHGYGEHGAYAEFHGWADPLAIFCRFSQRPWVGLLVPETDRRCLIRRAYLDETTPDELVQLLSLAELRFGKPSSFTDQETCKLILQELGCLPKETTAPTTESNVKGSSRGVRPRRS